MKFKKRKTRKGARINPSVKVSKDYHWRLLQALSDDLKGYLSDDDYELINLIVRSRDFDAYVVLDDIWGLQGIHSSGSGLDFSRAKARYCIASILKKYLPAPDPELDAIALKKVMAAEEGCARYNRSNHRLLTYGRDDFSVGVFTTARSFLKKLLGDVPVRAITDNSRHGPGANLDTRNGETSTYDKYRSWPYSCTGPALSYAKFMIERDERWLGALYDSYRERNNIPQHYPIDNRKFWADIINVVDHNRITFVPKNAKTSRSIAIEPALNLMLQLGVDSHIRRRLKGYGIDLDSQEPNRRLSREGSKYGLLSTLDLQAASDSISIGVCKALLPEEWFSFLSKLRSPKGKLDDGSFLVYEKMASMGNGYTFALESAIFAALVYAAYKENGIKPSFSRNCAVFGDDIIVLSKVSTDVVRALNLGGFSVNPEKSFFEGPVRESCGSDWFKGCPVRPIFLSEPPKTVQDLYVDYNRIQRGIELRFGFTPARTLELIKTWIPVSFHLWGPYSDEVFDSWLHTPVEGEWSNGFFRFTRLLKLPKRRQKANAFFFRKLMHNLTERKQLPWYLRSDYRKIAEANGSRFTVLAKGFTVRRKSSVSSHWQTVYTEPLPSIISPVEIRS